AILGRRGYQALLLEHLAHGFVLLARKAVRAQQLDRISQLVLLDLEGHCTVLAGSLARRDAVAQEQREHLVGVTLVEAGVEFLFACAQAEREQEGARERAEPCHSRPAGAHAAEVPKRAATPDAHCPFSNVCTA